VTTPLVIAKTSLTDTPRTTAATPAARRVLAEPAPERETAQ
jgi:hypothetical protein